MTARRIRERASAPNTTVEHPRPAGITLENVGGPARDILLHMARHCRGRRWCELSDEELAGFHEFSFGPWPIGRLVVHLCRYHWLERDRTALDRRRVRLTRRAWFRVVLPMLRVTWRSTGKAGLTPIPIDPDLSEREALLLAAYEREAIEGSFYEPYGTVGQTPTVCDSGGRPWPKSEIARIHRELRRREYITVAYHDPAGRLLEMQNSCAWTGRFAVRLTALTPVGRRVIAAYSGRTFATPEHAV